jgi:hypothetical protein
MLGLKSFAPRCSCRLLVSWSPAPSRDLVSVRAHPRVELRADFATSLVPQPAPCSAYRENEWITTHQQIRLDTNMDLRRSLRWDLLSEPHLSGLMLRYRGHSKLRYQFPGNATRLISVQVFSCMQKVWEPTKPKPHSGFLYLEYMNHPTLLCFSCAFDYLISVHSPAVSSNGCHYKIA